MGHDPQGPRAGPGRLEDDRLLTGTGTYVADIALPGMMEVTFVRSPLPHGVIEGIDVEAARADPRAAAVVSAADLTDVRPFPDYLEYSRPVAAFPLAVVCNVARVVFLAMLVEWRGYDLLDTPIHMLSGYVSFVLTLAILFLFAERRPRSASR